MSTEPSPEPSREAAFFTTIRSWRIVRSDQRVAGGVLGGVGARIGMAPAPARIVFVVIAIISFGLAAVAYAAAWALLPDAEGRIIIQDFGRGRPNVGALVAIAILTIVGFGSIGHLGLGDAFRWGGNNFGWFAYAPSSGMTGMGGTLNGFGHVFVLLAAVLIPLVILCGIVALIVWAVRSSKTTDRAAEGFARLPDGSIPDAPTAPSAVADDVTMAAPVATATLIAEPPAASAEPPIAAPTFYSAPPTPPRPRVPGPGKMGYLMALAWIPITAAITLYLSTTNQLAVFAGVVAGVIYVAGLGLILIITALRGRKLGFLGFVSVMALIPVAIAIGTAPQLREHYASGDWRDWVNEQVDPHVSYSAAPDVSVAPSAPFDLASKFYDYATVAIDGTCSATDGPLTPDYTGTVALSTVPAPQTITVTSPQTLLVIPTGTSVQVVSTATADMPVGIDVNWLSRDVTCNLNYETTTGVQLSNPEAPMLTVRLDDASQNGAMSLYIQEK